MRWQAHQFTTHPISSPCNVHRAFPPVTRGTGSVAGRQASIKQGRQNRTTAGGRQQAQQLPGTHSCPSTEQALALALRQVFIIQKHTAAGRRGRQVWQAGSGRPGAAGQAGWQATHQSALLWQAGRQAHRQAEFITLHTHAYIILHYFYIIFIIH